MNDDAQPIACPELNYAPPIRWHRTRSVQRRAIGLVLVLAIAAAAVWWGPRVWLRVRVMYWQSKCMEYTRPSDQVVYEEDPTAGAKLLGSDRAYQLYPMVASVARTGIRPVGHAPKPLGKLSGVYSPGQQPRTALFVHRLRSPGGNERLVSVRALNFDNAMDGGRGIMLVCNVTTPATWRSDAVPGPRRPQQPALWGLTSSDRLKMFAGQLDPSDAGCFVIPFDLNGSAGTIIGRLGDDDVIALEVRNWPGKVALPE